MSRVGCQAEPILNHVKPFKGLGQMKSAWSSWDDACRVVVANLQRTLLPDRCPLIHR